MTQEAGQGVDPPAARPGDLLDQPLDGILADHMRHRAICAVLRERAARGHVSVGDAALIVDFLQRDLPLHHADEVTGLFPLLRRRALPEDGLDPVLARLEQDHQDATLLVRDIVAALSPKAGAKVIDLAPELCRLIETYAAEVHRHLAIENAVVMVIARVRLHRNDLKVLAEGMKLRRERPRDVAVA